MQKLRPAPVLWAELNANRYCCEACGYRTHNKAMFNRHRQSARHFLMTTFREECPVEIKIVVMSYLPVWKIIQAPRVIARNALKRAWPRPAQYAHLPRVVLPDLLESGGLKVSPLVRSAGGQAWTIDSGRIRSYAVTL